MGSFLGETDVERTTRLWKVLGMAEATMALESDSEGKPGMTLGKCPFMPSIFTCRQSVSSPWGVVRRIHMITSCEAPASFQRHVHPLPNV